MRIVLAQINPTVGDLQRNEKKILQGIDIARSQKADLIVFPELALTGYPPEDLLLMTHFIQATEQKMQALIPQCREISAIIGFPRSNLEGGEKHLYNSAAVISHSQLLGYYDKVLLPTYDVFDERRYFEPGKNFPLWEIAGKKIALTICEDIWQHSALVPQTKYAQDPVQEYRNKHPDVLINISASPFSGNKPSLRLTVGAAAARALNCPVALCNQVGGNDGLVFDGFSFLLDHKGDLLHLAKGFDEEYLTFDPHKPAKTSFPPVDPIGNMYHALVLGLRDYCHKSGFQKACFGLSGGIDSAVVACIAKQALGQENLLGVIMPSEFSSQESMSDAVELAKRLKIATITIPIRDPFHTYLNLLESPFQGTGFGVTEENLQARIRGTLLMALSNKFGYIVLNTGNKSELAMGYATLYGDMCGGLGVIGDVTKMQVYALAQWINQKKELIPQSILERAPSAELRPNQKDSDSLPEYGIIDTVVREYVEEHKSPQEIKEVHNYSSEVVDGIVKAIHNSEYKRRQSPPLLRVSEKAFSLGRRFPIVQHWVG